MGRKARISGAARIEREQRVTEMLSMRIAGNTLQAIGDAMGVTAQAIHKTIKRAIERMADEATEQIRRIESLRLDEATVAVFPAASAGDLAAIDRMLHIMRRRARLMGLDTPVRWAPGAGEEFAAPHVRIEIVGGPDPEHVRRLEAALEGRDWPRITSLN
jgi:hypothetical protein